VTNLNRQGVEDLTVEAFYLQPDGTELPKEFATTEKNGSYRLKGLEPNKDVVVRIKKHDYMKVSIPE